MCIRDRAWHVSRHDGPITKLKDFLPVLLHFAIPFGLVVAQGDYGTCLLYTSDQHAAVNTFPGLVHTARHTMGVWST